MHNRGSDGGTYMEVMFCRSSSMPAELFPAPPPPLLLLEKERSGKNLLMSDLLQKISTGEQVQVGGQSSRELRCL